MKCHLDDDFLLEKLADEIADHGYKELKVVVPLDMTHIFEEDFERYQGDALEALMLESIGECDLQSIEEIFEVVAEEALAIRGYKSLRLDHQGKLAFDVTLLTQGDDPNQEYMRMMSLAHELGHTVMDNERSKGFWEKRLELKFAGYVGQLERSYRNLRMLFTEEDLMNTLNRLVHFGNGHKEIAKIDHMIAQADVGSAAVDLSMGNLIDLLDYRASKHTDPEKKTDDLVIELEKKKDILKYRKDALDAITGLQKCAAKYTRTVYSKMSRPIIEGWACYFAFKVMDSIERERVAVMFPGSNYDEMVGLARSDAAVIKDNTPSLIDHVAYFDLLSRRTDEYGVGFRDFMRCSCVEEAKNLAQFKDF